MKNSYPSEIFYLKIAHGTLFFRDIFIVFYGWGLILWSSHADLSENKETAKAMLFPVIKSHFFLLNSRGCRLI